jgi:hypothetical protein
MAEYRDELIDLEVGIIKGGILAWKPLSAFYLFLVGQDGLV